jgi:hypothetical protein
MKKTLLALLMFTTFGAMAQTAVVTPDQPTLPSIATVSPNAVTALGDATTNRVFIDQSGSNPLVNITQNGSGNTVGTSAATTVTKTVPTANYGTTSWTLSSPMYLRGADQVITTVQTGNNNIIGMAISNPTSGTGVGATVTLQQIGNSNSADVACGYGNASNGTTALTGCKDADLNWKFTGNSNHLQFRGSGDSIGSAIDVAGNGNSFFMDVLGDKHTQTIKVVGNDNVFNITQSSSGSNGSSIWVDQTGTGTKFVMSQTGTVDGVVNIKSVATGGQFHITQKN